MQTAHFAWTPLLPTAVFHRSCVQHHALAVVGGHWAARPVRPARPTPTLPLAQPAPVPSCCPSLSSDVNRLLTMPKEQKRPSLKPHSLRPTAELTRSLAKSPSGANPALPASVEQSYRQKCKDIKKRITEIESSNDLLTARIQRARRAIQRMRLERAFLLQQLEQRTDARVDDSEGSPSPPPTVGEL